MTTGDNPENIPAEPAEPAEPVTVETPSPPAAVLMPEGLGVPAGYFRWRRPSQPSWAAS
jgi:hypothetical protein